MSAMNYYNSWKGWSSLAGFVCPAPYSLLLFYNCSLLYFSLLLRCSQIANLLSCTAEKTKWLRLDSYKLQRHMFSTLPQNLLFERNSHNTKDGVPFRVTVESTIDERIGMVISIIYRLRIGNIISRISVHRLNYWEFNLYSADGDSWC